MGIDEISPLITRQIDGLLEELGRLLPIVCVDTASLTCQRVVSDQEPWGQCR